MSLQPYIRNIARRCPSSASKNVRGFAASALPKRKEEPSGPFSPREQLKVTKVGDTTVASVETNQAVSRLAVLFKAGSRYETDETQGVVHMLRISAGLGNSGASHFGLTRSVEASGGNITCSTGREVIAYTLEAARDQISSIDKFLQNASVNQVFKPWELSDNLPRARIERSIRTPELRLMELIHKAVYRKGLGYSLYSPKWMLGNHSSEMLSDYVRSTFTQAAVVGIGMPHEQACDFASRLNIKSGAPKQTAAGKFAGGADLRKETNDRLAYIALAVEGASLADPKKAAAAAAVARALGNSPRAPGSVGLNSKLAGALGADDHKASVAGFSASYTDSGIVGATISGGKTAETLTRKVADILRSAKFSAADATRAKGILKGDLALADESGNTLLESIGEQALLTGKPLTLSEQLSLIDSVTPEDMNAILSGGKLSMAVIGNVSKIPYLDQL